MTIPSPWSRTSTSRSPRPSPTTRSPPARRAHTFSLVIDNLGDSDADNVSVSDIAPAGLTFISEDSADCTITLAGNLSCSFAHLAANSQTTITVTYDVPATTNAGVVTNTASVTSDEDSDTMRYRPVVERPP